MEWVPWAGLVITLLAAVIASSKDLKRAPVVPEQKRWRVFLRKNWVPLALIVLAIAGGVVAGFGIVAEVQAGDKTQLRADSLNREARTLRETVVRLQSQNEELKAISIQGKKVKPRFSLVIKTDRHVDFMTWKNELDATVDSIGEANFRNWDGFVHSGIRDVLFPLSKPTEVGKQYDSPLGLIRLSLSLWGIRLFVKNSGLVRAEVGEADQYLERELRVSLKDTVFAIEGYLAKEVDALDIYEGLLKAYNDGIPVFSIQHSTVPDSASIPIVVEEWKRHVREVQLTYYLESGTRVMVTMPLAPAFVGRQPNSGTVVFDWKQVIRPTISTRTR